MPGGSPAADSAMTLTVKDKIQVTGGKHQAV
jgi:hypothetical protein